MNIDVDGVNCLLYYDVGHGSLPVLVSSTPTHIYAPIEIPKDSLSVGETVIACKFWFLVSPLIRTEN